MYRVLIKYQIYNINYYIFNFSLVIILYELLIIYILFISLFFELYFIYYIYEGNYPVFIFKVMHLTLFYHIISNDYYCNNYLVTNHFFNFYCYIQNNNLYNIRFTFRYQRFLFKFFNTFLEALHLTSLKMMNLSDTFTLFIVSDRLYLNDWYFFN